ncbi:type II secretion system secretin GspD [Sulfurirhabdus autotrophica]|uniref:Type IV pilus biogenesis and competence protein PilQ n=1 Tax=Sulfurirhabdus autotrophica TaxID=1706046 RepID=A0A4R3XVU8_9PROT|nr:type II secretion system secretin GspD [Sulfurirhabdus autotrophica]TCV83406.1 general secretion pathway protein D [Sulfurirhabdus autotrophica]
MRFTSSSIWSVVGLILSSLLVFPSFAEDEQVTLNFVNADIDSVVKAVGVITGKNFVIDPRVKGTINIVSSKPVPRNLTYQILLSALRLQGFAAVEGQGVVKILPEADAKQNFSVTTGKTLTTSGDKIVTQVYPLQYESAAQLVPVLRPLIGPNNSISAYPNTNTLVITDYADNIKRINKIIDSIDQPSGSELTIIKLQYASALDMAQQLSRLISEGPGVPAAPGAQAGAGQQFVVSADVRSNSLLIRSSNPAQLTRLRSLVTQMDVPTSESGNMHVVYLRNAEAGKLAETLRAVLSGEVKSAQVAGAVAGQPGLPQTSLGTGIIQADTATNSLIITAPDNVYNSLRSVIDKLDARRAQVFVEALIAEITMDKAAEFGIQWQAPLGSGGNNSAVVAGVNFGSGGSNIASLSTGTVLPSAGLNLGLLQRLTIGGKEIVGLTALARALESDVNANILSTPNLLTMDNEEAKIVIGKNVPFITGSYAQAASSTGGAVTVNPFQTIERKDVGLTLKIKPQVAEGGTVKLQILQEASSIQDTTNQAGIITNKRSIESTVLVNDGQTIVLGGLIQDDVQDGVDKVPGLGDIPVFGSLFKYEKRKHVKTNLMVFIRPIIIRNAIASDSLTGDRYDYIRNVQGQSKLKSHLFLPDIANPQLPERKVNQVAVEGEQTGVIKGADVPKIEVIH